jgi:hypothetical protein
MKDANIIPLQFWQDPQGDVILIYGEQECSVYFTCWASAGVDAEFIGNLSFESASAVRSFGWEFIPYQTKPHGQKSWILELPDSELAREHVRLFLSGSISPGLPAKWMREIPSNVLRRLKAKAASGWTVSFPRRQQLPVFSLRAIRSAGRLHSVCNGVLK